jgi:hypothetical protein
MRATCPAHLILIFIAKYVHTDTYRLLYPFIFFHFVTLYPVSVLKSIPALLNFNFQQCASLILSAESVVK